MRAADHTLRRQLARTGGAGRRRAAVAVGGLAVSLVLFGCGSANTGSGSTTAGARAGTGTAAGTASAAQSAGSVTSARVTPARRSRVTASNWTTYHATAEATGVQAARIDLRPAKRAWTSPTLDGQIYGEPLVADGRVIAATENDTVYALAADSGRILWSRHLATPVPSSALPCGDISPEVGITSTPVIDTARDEVFVDADTRITGPSASHGVEAAHRLYGLNLLTGRVQLSQAAMPAAGEDQLAQLQRSGLALDAGRVIIAYGQNAGDCPGPNGPAHGYVVSIPEGGGHLDYLQLGHGSDRGAVWMGGSSPVIDPHHNVYVASGDGYNQGPGQRYDDSDAVIELSPTMRTESIFYPRDWQTLSGDDLDLGTGDPALVDGDVLQIGKTDIAYLLRQGHLGGEGGALASESICSGNPDGGHAVLGSTVYINCPDGLTAIRVSRTAPHLKVLWTSSAGDTGPPVIADGLIWTVGSDGQIHGLSPASGSGVATLPYTGAANHFPTPAIADGLLLAPETDQIAAYDGPAGLPAAPAR